MTPPALATKLGGYTGITLSVCPSVDAWLGKMVQSHNCLPFTPIIMKLHTQTPHESRVCSIDFWVKGQGHNALITEKRLGKIIPAHNCYLCGKNLGEFELVSVGIFVPLGQPHSSLEFLQICDTFSNFYPLCHS